MVADIFTKALPRDKHLYCMTHLGMCLIPQVQQSPSQAFLTTTPLYLSGKFLPLKPSLSGRYSLHPHISEGYITKTSQDIQALCIMTKHHQVPIIKTQYDTLKIKLTWDLMLKAFFNLLLLLSFCFTYFTTEVAHSTSNLKKQMLQKVNNIDKEKEDKINNKELSLTWKCTDSMQLQRSSSTTQLAPLLTPGRHKPWPSKTETSIPQDRFG